MGKIATVRIGVALVVAAGAGAAMAASSSSMLPSQLPGRLLAAHNAVRAQAGAPGLVWDPALGTAAARYALQLAMTNVFEHSDRKARPVGTRGDSYP